MTLRKSGYLNRLIDPKVAEMLQAFGAVAIDGSKWCGKTWTSLNHGNSVIYLGDHAGNFQNRQLALLNPSIILEGAAPRMIDEWQEVPPCGMQCGSR